MEILITNGSVITMNQSMDVIDSGAVAIDGNEISGVGPGNGMRPGRDTRIIDARGGIVMPGLVNCHTRAASLSGRVEAGTGRPGNAGSRAADTAAVSAERACMAMILDGTTCFCDVSGQDDAVAAAAMGSGLRALVGQPETHWQTPRVDGPGLQARESGSRVARSPVVMVAADTDPVMLQALSRSAVDQGACLLLLLPVSRMDISRFEQRHAARPLLWLSRLGVLGAHAIVFCSLDVTEEEMEMLSGCRAGVAHCPEATMDLAPGIAPVHGMMRYGVSVGLGTGGGEGFCGFDMFREMDRVAKLHKVVTMNPEAMDAKTVVSLATIQGAGLLGLGTLTGSLEPGKRADVIVVDTASPRMQPMYNPYSHLVYAASGTDVSWVIADGKILMENRRLLTISPARVLSRASVQAGRG